MVQIKIMEHEFLFIAGEFIMYRVLGGHLSMLGWLQEYSDFDQVITTERERVNFVLNLMGYYIGLVQDIQWPHRE